MNLELHPSSLIPPPFGWAGVAQLVEHQPSKLRVASSSLVSRSTFQAVNRAHDGSRTTRPRSSGVERLLGKEEVMSSNLIAGSIKQAIHNQLLY